MKNLLLILTALLFTPSFSHASFYANMVEEDAYLSANATFDKQDYEAAAKEYSTFIEKFPESKYRAGALLKLAEVSENIEDAMKYYNMTINDYPNSASEAEAVFDLAKLFYAQGDYKKARVYFNIVISKFPDMVWVEESYYLLMLCALAEKDNNIFEKAYIEYNEKGFFSMKNRVNMAYAGYAFSSGKYLKALELYREIIAKTDGKDKNIYMPLIYKNAADSARKTNDLSAAERFESDLKFKFPDSPEAKNEKADSTPGHDGMIYDNSSAKTVTKTAKPFKSVLPQSQKEFYTIQIGAYSNKKYCDLTAQKLEDKKYEVFVKKDGKFYKLSVGRFKTKDEADAFIPEFAKKEKIKSYLVKQVWE